ncbi:hypothetical protein D0Z07_7549 [Hyphodiscus hymeniophilus]|uniref:F-box domain-containing protein n=1 Tax=Hyphodiscus hymeniophilus TaxID=353542 RepID=A0A9P6VEV1_9HELO|nr:hypothetical protein D0Z07_7549 [Hyphodiscus hymeniophilus]
MKWFSKKKAKGIDEGFSQSLPRQQYEYGTPPASDFSARLPAPLLERIFSFVCPHAQDETYTNCEESAIGDTCMLCDLRDVAHCAQVSRRWRKLATNVMYHSIRIDAVHYCAREEELSEKRKRKSRINRNAEPEDTPSARLRLLCRTLREDQGGVAMKVQFIKLAYMTRETCKADLARTVAVTPTLRYVDLPEGIFMDDPSCDLLKQEIQARCPDLRKMSYMGGAERSLELMSNGQLWRDLEVLELSKLNMDPTILRRVLGELPQLRALKVKDMKTFDDRLFRHNNYLAPFPALSELLFENTPNVTAEGLATYLFRSEAQDALKTLSLTNTGVQPSSLHQILSVAPSLTFLSIIESISTSCPTGVPLLKTESLEIFHFEITSASSANSYASTIESYYTYLASSLLSHSLPALRQLYVRDPNFPELLIDLAPPAPAFASDPDNFTPNRSPNLSPHLSPSFGSPNNNRFSSNNPFAGAAASQMPPQPGLTHELEVFSKGLDEMEWNFTSVQPPKGPGRRGSASAPRPVSSYGLGENMGRSWGQGAGARKSVIVGNGFGGFLAVPAEDERPLSSGGEKGRRASKYDMWR